MNVKKPFKPMPESNVQTLAALHFRHSGNWMADCTLVLRSDRTIQLLPSASLQGELDDLLGVVSTSSLKWGASLVAIFAAVGTAFYMKNRRALASTAFVTSGLAGAAAYGVRRYSSTVLPWLFSPIPVDSVTIEWLEDDSLRIRINDGPVRRFTANLEPSEFESAEAVAFTQAFTAVRR